MCLCLIFNYVSCSWFSRVRYKAVSLLSKTRKENIRNNKKKITSFAIYKIRRHVQKRRKKKLFVGEHDEEKMEKKKAEIETGETSLIKKKGKETQLRWRGRWIIRGRAEERRRRRWKLNKAKRKIENAKRRQGSTRIKTKKRKRYQNEKRNS